MGQQWTGHFTMASQDLICISGCWGRGRGRGAPYPWHSQGSLRAVGAKPSSWKGTGVPTPSAAHSPFLALLALPFFNPVVVPPSLTLYPLSPPLQNLCFFRSCNCVPRTPYPFKARWHLPSDLPVVRPSGCHPHRVHLSNTYLRVFELSSPPFPEIPVGLRPCICPPGGARPVRPLAQALGSLATRDPLPPALLPIHLWLFHPQ